MTKEQIIEDIEKYLLCHHIPRGQPTALLIKQNVHFGLYVKLLKNLGTEKHYKYIERAVTLEDFACFCMTELSHGSNVQGLKTTATYDPNTKEFILNTPSDEDMKFWIGNLGKSAHVGVVFAQLYTQGKRQGVHPFVVQFRDRKYHQPLPGLLIGDCGAKIGLHGIDNGFIKFSNFRVPKDALLDKFFQVDDEGNYSSLIPTKNKRFAFILSSLIVGRILITVGCVHYGVNFLGKALRYSHLRRQFSSDMKMFSQESTLISYQLHQSRIIPRFARMFVYKYGVDEVIQLYFKNRQSLVEPKNNSTEVKLLHALVTCAKSHMSSTWQKDLEEIRQSYGGLGYSFYSEVSSILNDNDVNQTWEGDNKVLLQQTAKFVLKNAQNAIQNKPLQHEQVHYLKEYFDDIEGFKSMITDDLRNIDNIQRIIKGITAHFTFKTLMHLQSSIEKKGMYDAYLESLPFHQNVMSVYFGEVFFLEAYLRRISLIQHKETKEIFEKLLLLHANYMIAERAGDFRDGDFLSSDHIQSSKENVIEICKELKDELIPLTEVGDFYYYNIYAQPDFYERFISKVVQANQSFGKLESRHLILASNK